MDVIHVFQLKHFFNSDTAHFLNVKRTNGGCELDEKEIKDSLTVKMIALAFTVVKKEMSHITKILLEDKSDFPCKRKDNSIVGISMALHELMFKQCTWYECNFKAKLADPSLQKIYEERKVNFKNKPPIKFDFNNNDLNDFFRPILMEIDSWNSFFKYIKEHYNDTKCDIIFPWYASALKLYLIILILKDNHGLLILITYPN